MIEHPDTSSSPQVSTLDTPDMMTLLFASEGQRQTKIIDGWAPAERITPARFWRHSEREVFSLADLKRVIVEVAAMETGIIVRGMVTDEARALPVIRRLSSGDRDDAATLEQVDHHWLCVDLDKVTTPAGLDLADRSTWGAGLRDIIAAELPECFHGVECVFQWSSSAGRVSTLVGLHLWFWSDRPVCSQSLHAWAARGRFCDPGMFLDVQPHSVAYPIFTGGALDPVPGKRVGTLAGRPYLMLPDGVVGVDDFEDIRAAELAQLMSRARQNMASMRQKGAGGEDEGFIKAQAHRMADAALRRLTGAGKGNRDEARRDACYNLGGLYGYIPERDLLAEAVLATHALFSGDGEREAAARCKRAEVNFKQGLGRPVPIDPWTPPARQDRQTTRQQRRKEQDKVTTAVESGATLDASASWMADIDGLGAMGAPDGACVKLDAESLTAVAGLDVDAIEMETLDEARLEVRDMIERAIDRGGVTMVKAQPGLGKSRAMMAELILRARRAPDKRIDIIMQSHDLCLETMVEYRKRAPDLWIEHATTRTAENCILFDEVRAFGDRRADLASRRCRECDIHPNNIGEGADACNVMKNRTSMGAQIQFKTAALWAVTAAEMDDETKPDLAVVDESVWGQCVMTDGLDVPKLAHLIAGGELTTGEMVTTMEGKRVPATEALLQLCRKSQEEGRRIGMEVLLEVIGDALVYEEDEERVEQAYVDARSKVTSREAIEVLRGSAGWRARRALAECMGDDWRGAYIQGGEIKVGYGQSFPVEAHDAVIAMDATAQPLVTRAFFGDDCAFEEVTVAVPDHVEIVKLDACFGPSSHIGPGKDESMINQARYACALEWLKPDKGTLIVTMKRWREEGSTSRAILDAICSDAHVIHHNGTDARGSNLYRGCHTAFVPHYKAPRGATEQAGQILSRMLEDEYSDETKDAWHEIACGQLEGAPLAQVAARCRYLDATADNPKRIVYAAPEGCDADIMGIGVATTTKAVDDLLMEVGGMPSTYSVDDIMKKVTTVVQMVAPTKMPHSVNPIRWEDLLVEPSTRLQLALSIIAQKGATAATVEPAESLYAGSTFAAVLAQINRMGADPCAWIEGQIRRHYEGDWSVAGHLKALGVQVHHIEVSGVGAGKAFPVVFADELTANPEQMYRCAENLAAQAGAHAWRFRGTEQWRNVHAVEEALLNALTVVTPFDENAGTMKAFLESVAVEMGEEWNARKVERALMRSAPSFKTKAQHLRDEGVKAHARAWSMLVENLSEDAMMMAHRAAEAEGRDPAEEPLEPHLRPMLEALRARYAAEGGCFTLHVGDGRTMT